VENIGILKTEQVNPEWSDLDKMSTLDIVRLMNSEDAKLVKSIANEADSIARAVDLVAEKIGSGGRLIYIGAGSSGRLGILDAAECQPTFGVEDKTVQGLMAGGEGALVKAVEGAEDDETASLSDLKKLGVGESDVLVAISASGRTPYCIGAMRYARENRCAVISITCNKAARMSVFADVAIEIDSGPEVLAGSTRLKAGTAQKMVLNMISTLSMVKIGKVYKNLMVDMKATNIKLKDRAVRILMLTAELRSSQDAIKLLDVAGWNLKTAIVMSICQMGKETAERNLSENEGFVRKVYDQYS
jgi:N-acetylmuramic acid 6-phosphate etherase